MKNVVRKFLTILLIAVFLVSTGIFALRFWDRHNSEEIYSQALELAGIPSEDLLSQPIEIPQATQLLEKAQAEIDPNIQVLRSIRLSSLKNINPDVVGWICIPDTKINYPITQGQDNEYYLSHAWNNKSNFVGAIFLETMNCADFTDFNTILYGHNMKNGSMFAGLHDYKDPAYWAQHPYVYLVTAEGILRYEIFSSYNADVDSKTYGLSFRQDTTREAFIQMALENSDIDTGLEPAITDRILTLSTCTGFGYSQRRVVHAYLPVTPQ